MRGRLIAFEGLDRTGKSTQAKKLTERLNATLIKFPNRETPVGKLIDQYLRKEIEMPLQAIHLLFSANRWELKDKITSLIDEGKDVILDRYSYSGVAYTHAQGLEIDWCGFPEIGLPTPDVVIFLSLKDPSTRKGFGVERYEVPALQAKVLEIFKEKFDGVCPEWQVLEVDNMDIDQVHGEVMGKIAAIPEDRGTIRPLWQNTGITDLTA